MGERRNLKPSLSQTFLILILDQQFCHMLGEYLRRSRLLVSSDLCVGNKASLHLISGLDVKTKMHEAE